MTSSDEAKCQTILVVDDDEAVLKTVVGILERARFRVLYADSTVAALKLAEKTSLRIDMLVSAVDMPQMSGPDLGELLKETRHDIHVMLMSGSTNGNLLVLNYGWAYIQKRDVPTKLVEMVRYVLGSTNRSQLGGQEFDSRVI